MHAPLYLTLPQNSRVRRCIIMYVLAQVPFPVGQVVAGPKCVWVLGAGGQVAVYQLSTLQPAAPALLGRSTVPEGATAALSSVVLDARTVLVRRGSLLEGFYLSDLGQLVAIDAADVDDVAPCDGAMVSCVTAPTW